MPAINNRSNLSTDPVRNFRFLVKFAPHDESAQKFGFKPTLGFTSVSGLSVATESIPYREGGYNTTVHQIPGQSTFSPITMQRGVLLGTPQHWNWMKRLFSVVGNTQKGGNFRSDIIVYVLAHPSSNSASSEIALNGNKGLAIDDKVHAKFRIFNAWPTTVAYSDLNAGDNALLVEQVTFVHEGFTVVTADKFDADVKNAGY